MVDQPKNDFLDLPSEDESSNNDAGYDSEAADQKPALRVRKRRRVSQDDDDDDLESASGALSDEQNSNPDESEVERRATATHKKKARLQRSESKSSRDDAKKSTTQHHTPRKAPSTKRPKSAPKPGVVYLSRIPPFMKPSVLRTYLTPYAPKHGLHRLFLTPEPPASHAARVRSGGNKKRMYGDGWVEFRSKGEAKGAVAALNARIVGGKKGGWYHDDVWNMRYLRGFRWDDLMGQMRAENAERDGRMRAEVAQSARENARFLAGVEQGKAIAGMQEKRRAKRARDGVPVGLEEAESRPRATFAQNVVKDKRATVPKKQPEHDADTTTTTPPPKAQDDVQRVLGNIF